MKLKVALLHARYRQRGGEDQSFEQEIIQFSTLGHHVLPVVFDNDELRTPAGLGRALTERFSALIAWSPDLVYINNTWPAINPLALRHLKKTLQVPFLQAIRNYRISCLRGTHYREGSICHECVRAESPIPGMMHRCQDNSLAQSAGAALHSRFTLKNISSYSQWYAIANSPFTSDYLRLIGLPHDKIFVRENFLADDPSPSLTPGHGVVFVGRLVHEKGIEWLVDLWRTNPGLPTLTVVGGGPLAEELTTKEISNVRFAGPVEPHNAQHIMRDAALTVVPSRWDEPFGRVAIESMAVGTPVLCSTRGALPGTVRDGGRALSMESDLWRESILEIAAAANQPLWRHAALETFRSNYTASVATGVLKQIIDRASSGAIG